RDCGCVSFSLDCASARSTLWVLSSNELGLRHPISFAPKWRVGIPRWSVASHLRRTSLAQLLRCALCAECENFWRRLWKLHDAIYWDKVCIRSCNSYSNAGCLDNQPPSRHGRSSIEFVFSDDLKPDRREQSAWERLV